MLGKGALITTCQKYIYPSFGCTITVSNTKLILLVVLEPSLCCFGVDTAKLFVSHGDLTHLLTLCMLSLAAKIGVFGQVERLAVIALAEIRDGVAFSHVGVDSGRHELHLLL
eukprot:5268793-Ditylum_brightwellii.AAC.1